MLVKALSKKLLGYLATFLFVASVASCGGGGGGSTGTSTESPIAGDVVLIEARISGGITAVELGSTVNLDGTKSYISSNSPKFTSSNASLSYSWELTHIPEGSSAALENANTATPRFTADVLGDYMVQLVVSANGYTSDRMVQYILVVDPNAPPATKRYGKYPGHLGRTSNCIECHTGDQISDDSGNLIVGKHESHVATSSLCEACHSILGFDVAVNTDHNEVFGDCSGCHNNVKAIGMSEFHSPIESECDACHNTVSFLTLESDGSFDHSNINRACQGCHNGKVARGKDADHSATGKDCGFCHTTVDFKNAYPDHTDPDGIVFGNDCSSCHVVGSGKAETNSDGFHGDMSVDCNVCHNIFSFASEGTFDHGVIGFDPFLPACSECHAVSNNIGAIGKSVGHPVTSDVCSDCHNTVDFAEVSDFDHSVLAVDKLCADCHGDSAPVDLNAGDIDATGIPTPTAFFVHVDIGSLDCGDCHTPGTFKTGIFDHSNVDMGITRCDSCHNGLTSTGLSSFTDHIPLSATSPADCDVCHTNNDTTGYTSFTTPVEMEHEPVGGGVDISVCSACHDGVKSSGKSVGHVPTRSLDCGDCHVNTSNYTVFTLSPWDHAAIGAGSDTDCASCHDAGYATPKTVTHIPSVAECSVCHTDTSVGGFAINNFRAAAHDSLTEGCEGCHVSKFFPDAIDANKYKASGHLPTAQDCQFCHSAAAADFTDYSNFSHAGINSNCASCHDGSFVGVLPNAKGEPSDAIHTTTSADCSICHTTTQGFLDGAYVDHSSPDIQNVRCDNCHNGDFSFPTDPNAPVIKGKNFISNHPATSSDCSVCHASDPAVDFKDGGVDHTSPEVLNARCDSCHNGTDATGLSDHPTNNHVPVGTDDCDSCHTAGGAFKPSTFNHVGITNNCASCHDGSYIDAQGGPNDTVHNNTTSDCSVCHNTNAFAGAKFDHSTVSTNTRCDTCHNGNAAAGKEPPVGHVPTSLDCRECHQTSGFIPATFDHSQNSSNARCDSCHNESPGYATPKTANHTPTTQDCGVCHFGFDSFAGATFDHSGVSASTRCDSCHIEGSNTATGKDDAVPAHLSTALDCRSCHDSSKGTFAGGSWTHDASANGNCTNCHASDKTSGHINTSDQCDVCHTTSTWGFDHPLSIPGLGGSGPYNPLDHRQSLSCSACHGNTITSTIPNSEWSNTTYKPYCAGCHDRDYDTGERRHRSLAEDKDCYGSCHEHRISSSNWD